MRIGIEFRVNEIINKKGTLTFMQHIISLLERALFSFIPTMIMASNIRILSYLVVLWKSVQIQHYAMKAVMKID